MADGSTTSYSFTLPEVGASEDSWGTKLNANWSLADDLLDGTSAIAPNLTEGSWKVGGVAVTSTATELNLLDGVTATTAELNYVDGVTSAIQTQIDAKISTTEIGTSVQAYNAANAVTNAAQTFTASQRGTVDPQNTMPFDLNVANNFTCTPSGTIDLAFDNETAGQTGMIYLSNGSNYSVTASGDVHISAADLTAISATGNYILSYFCPDGTNVYLSASAALIEGS